MGFYFQNCSDLLWEKNCFCDSEKLLEFEAEDLSNTLEQLEFKLEKINGI